MIYKVVQMEIEIHRDSSEDYFICKVHSMKKQFFPALFINGTSGVKCACDRVLNV